MTDKADVIAGVLRTHADELDGQVADLEKKATLHEGARDAVTLIQRNLAGILPQVEREIGADEDLNKESSVRALIHVSHAMQRVATSLGEFQKNQANRVLAVAGQVQLARQIAAQARAKADLEIAKSKRRDEVMAERRAAAAKPAEGGATNGKQTKPPPTPKAATKKRAPAKRKTPTKRKTSSKAKPAKA